MFDVKCVSEALDSPAYKDWVKVKGIVRYLAGTPDYLLKLDVTKSIFPDKYELAGWSDTAFAGDREKRRSTSCALLR